MITGTWLAVDPQTGTFEECETRDAALKKAQEFIDDWLDNDGVFNPEYAEQVFVCIRTHFTYRNANNELILTEQYNVASDT